MRSLAKTLVIGLALAGLVACGGGDGDKKSGDKTEKTDDGGGEKSGGASKAAYDASAHKGAVSGTVKLAGDAPAAKKLTIAGDDFCQGAWKDGHIDQRYEVGEGGALPHVFVWAKNGPHKEMTFKTSDSPNGGGLVVDQKGCVYSPHVFGVMKGETFTFKNSDKTTHNVHVKPKRNDKANISQAPGKSDTVTFKKKEKVIPVSCDVHSWMQCHAHVREHPFFATTDASGKFAIKGLPDGDYEFVAWHENHGETTFKVSVKDGKADPVEVSFGK